MFTNGNGNVGNDTSDEEDLDFDMWEGQFEFVGNNVNSAKWNDFYQSNGVRKQNSSSSNQV